jgi:hypothetical protein
VDGHRVFPVEPPSTTYGPVAVPLQLVEQLLLGDRAITVELAIL